MGDYSYLEMALGIGVFFLVTLTLLSVLHKMGADETDMSSSLATILSVGLGATAMSLYFSTTDVEISKRNADTSVAQELSTVLDLELTSFKMERVEKDDFDYSIEVDDTVYWVGYDFDLGKIDHIVSSDKYLYKRGEK